MQTSIEVQNGKIIICGPYSEKNNAEWRAVGGRFSGGNWEIPDTDGNRALIVELFGAKSEDTDVIVPADNLRDGGIVQIGGYVLAQRRGRDSRVQMPDGVTLETGSFHHRGGSVKNPSVGLESDMSFRLRCRRSFAEANDLQEVMPSATARVEI